MDPVDMYEVLLRELFNDTLLNSAFENLRAGNVELAMDDLITGLHERRMDSSENEWDEFARLCLSHPIRELLHQDPLTMRAHDKPSGYAGDSEMLEMILSDDATGGPAAADASELGLKIFQYTRHLPVPAAQRRRLECVSQWLDRRLQESDSCSVLAIAAGRLWGARRSAAFRAGRFERFCAVDSDISSFEGIEDLSGCENLEMVPASMRKLMGGELSLGEFDVIYTPSLLDRAAASSASHFVSRMFQMLRPGGSFFASNLVPDLADDGYLESYMRWKISYRSQREVEELAAEIPVDEIDDVTTEVDAGGQFVIFEVSKN